MKKNKTNKKASSMIATTETTAVAVARTHQDLVLALLIVSLTVNLFVLVGWVTLQVTSVYDSEVAAFLFTR